jgi:hypothetical protein
MMPIADLAFTTSEDLYAVTTDVRDASAQSTSTVKLCYFTECTRFVGPASQIQQVGGLGGRCSQQRAPALNRRGY